MIAHIRCVQYLASRVLLGKLLGDIALIVHLLTQFRPDHDESEAPVNKRAKLDSYVTIMIDQACRLITFLEHHMLLRSANSNR